MQNPPIHTDTPRGTAKAVFWMLFPVALLVTSVTGWLLMVSIAVDDPGFAVEADYYKKAANYDAVIQQRAENSRLGYRVELETFATRGTEEGLLTLHVSDRLGAPISDATVEVSAMPVARAFDVQQLTLGASGKGAFAASFERPRLGLWELRVTVRHRGSVFTETIRPELAPAGSVTTRFGQRVDVPS